MSKSQFTFLFRLSFLFFIIAFFSISAEISAQARDNLTYEEIELVRDVQELDKRMEIYVKAIDRRLMVLSNDRAQTEQLKKDAKKWGELPTGTRVELLLDIKKILREAIDKIDDVAARDEKSDLIPYAVHTLADGAQRFAPELKKFLDSTTDNREKGVIYDSIDFCNQIIEVAQNIPKPVKKRKKN